MVTGRSVSGQPGVNLDKCDDPISSELFGAVHRSISPTHQPWGIVAISVHRYPETRRHRAADGVVEGAHSHPQVLSDAFRSGHVGVWQHHQELFPAPATNRV